MHVSFFRVHVNDNELSLETFLEVFLIFSFVYFYGSVGGKVYGIPLAKTGGWSIPNCHGKLRFPSLRSILSYNEASCRRK